MKKITTYTINNETYYIMKDNNGFWGIHERYVTDGRLNKVLNGIEGNLNKTLNECLKSCYCESEFRRIQSKTDSKSDLLNAMQDIIEKSETLFN